MTDDRARPVGPMTGIWPILYAYFDRDNRLLRDAMRRQAQTVLANGAPGVAVLGLATEVDKLAQEERHDVIRWASQDIEGRAPLAVTIHGESVDSQRALASFAIEHGATRLILQPPPVNATGVQPEGFYVEFFGRVMDGLGVPVGIQNAPEYLGVGLSVESIVALADSRPEFAFVKGEASSTVICEMVEHLGGRLPVLNGRGGLELIESLRAGCAGMIVAPDTFDHQLAVWRLVREGQVEQAYERYARTLPAIVFVMQSLRTLVCYGKRIAAWRMGFDVEHDRSPALAPTTFGISIAREYAQRLGALRLFERA